jgi:methionine salvage enolase-phosphatase E1
MAGRLWAQGYEAGRAEANREADTLRKIQTRQVSGIAGKLLREHKAHALGWESKQEQYAVGFFDGFIDRASELRAIL